MKRFVKSLVSGTLCQLGYELIRLRKEANQDTGPIRADASAKASQLLLSLHYQRLLLEKLPLPKLSDVGLRVYSQCDEDGIILFLFSIIGAQRRTFVEIGAGNAIECNCANLAISFGWHGLFIDADERNASVGREFYARHPDTFLFPPKVIQARATPDNVNELIADQGFSGEIDLLSIDIDGMDYWIWESIHCISPRVVVVEANGKFGMRSISVPYSSQWSYESERYPHYHGASLPALTSLAESKNYRLVGANRFGFNAFYVRSDIATDILPAVTIESCRKHPTRATDEEIFSRISDLPFTYIQ